MADLYQYTSLQTSRSREIVKVHRDLAVKYRDVFLGILLPIEQVLLETLEHTN